MNKLLKLFLVFSLITAPVISKANIIKKYYPIASFCAASYLIINGLDKIHNNEKEAAKNRILEGLGIILFNKYFNLV